MSPKDGGGTRLGCTASMGSRTLAVSPEVQGLGLPRTGCGLCQEPGQGSGQKRRAPGGCLPSTSEVTLPPPTSKTPSRPQSAPRLSSPRQSAVSVWDRSDWRGWGQGPTARRGHRAGGGSKHMWSTCEGHYGEPVLGRCPWPLQLSPALPSDPCGSSLAWGRHRVG